MIRYQKKIEIMRKKYQSAKEIHKIESKNAFVAAKRDKALKEAKAILLAAAERIQNEVHQRIAHTVTKCLACTFPDPYEFKIEFVQRRGKTEADLYFVRNGMRVSPLKASGGGVVDVASFVLRVASIMQRRPRPRLLIVADEPFKFVSKEYLPRVRKLLEMLASDLGFQFLIVTHLKELEDASIE